MNSEDYMVGEKFHDPSEALGRVAIPETLRGVLARLRASGFEAFLGRGGRDVFLDESRATGMATSALPTQVQSLFERLLRPWSMALSRCVSKRTLMRSRPIVLTVEHRWSSPR